MHKIFTRKFSNNIQFNSIFKRAQKTVLLNLSSLPNDNLFKYLNGANALIMSENKMYIAWQDSKQIYNIDRCEHNKNTYDRLKANCYHSWTNPKIFFIPAKTRTIKPESIPKHLDYYNANPNEIKAIISLVLKEQNKTTSLQINNQPRCKTNHSFWDGPIIIENKTDNKHSPFSYINVDFESNDNLLADEGTIDESYFDDFGPGE